MPVQTNKLDSIDAPGAPQAITAYKALDKNFRCQEFQFEIGKTYTHPGEVRMCESGFHACERPLDVLQYYPPFNDTRYALVTLRGVSDETSNDTKLVAAEITIERELTLRELIEADVNYLAGQATADSSGHSWAAASSGEYSTAVAAGDESTAVSCGGHSTAATVGGYSTAASSGRSSTAISCGEHSAAGASGHASTAVASGNYSTTAAAAGYESTAVASGTYSTAAASGYESTAACGSNGFACVAGLNGAVKGGPGSALALGYRDEAGRPRIKVLYVGEDGIEPDTWYHCDAGGVTVRAQ